MSVFGVPEKTQRRRRDYGFSLQEIVIFAFGAFAAMIVGVAATGGIPLI